MSRSTGDDPAAPLPPEVGDRIDAIILQTLRRDGRATLATLSQNTGLSVSAVQSRVQKLERRQIISGYRAVVDDKAIGFPISRRTPSAGPGLWTSSR